MSGIDEIVGEFLIESYENLDRYDADLLALEQDPTDAETLSSVFRTIHTIKGTSGFFGFDQLEKLAHVGENLLGRLREGELPLTEEIASALLDTGDTLRRMLGVIEETGEEGDLDVSELAARLTRLYEGEGSAADAVAADEPVEVADEPVAADAPAADEPAPEDQQAYDAQGNPIGRIGDLLSERGKASPEDIAAALAAQESGDARRLGEILVNKGAADPEDVEAYVEEQARSSGRSVSDSSIRVDVGLLDELMNLVGELVLARNQIVQLVNDEQDSRYAGASQRLNLITTELQEGVMKTRMQPIGNVWNKLPRVVRDLSLAVGKRVDLEMVGQDTELDKTIIEAIKDPLTHLVRNAVDHGVELPEVREAAGKPAVGQMTLRAYHEGGQVNIELSDDGKGIDANAVRDKAIKQGVITAEQAAQMVERELLTLIFSAGVSTAQQVTNVSGRGVGMDVVRTNIERIGGSIDIATEIGQGTTIKVKIPLTLAIVPALIVSTSGDRYAIPQLSLIELVRLEGEQARSGIERVHGSPVYRLRGRLLPIVDLSRELERRGDHDEEREVVNIVVLHADGQQFGLIVDDIHDTEEIVVKPLGSHLKDAALFAGATIMGDGRVALILDVMGIAERARVVSETRERADSTEQFAASDITVTERKTLLLVEVGDDRRAAIDLTEVERLEEFDISAIEWGSGREVVQYRDAILPLMRLADALGVGGGYLEEGSMDVVVHTIDGHSVGLVVGKILDIVEQEIRIDHLDDRPEVLGSVVVQGRVTDVLDTHALVGAGGQDSFGSYAGV